MKDAHRYWVPQEKQEKDRTERPDCEIMKLSKTTKQAIRWAKEIPNPQDPCGFGPSQENMRGIAYIFKKTQGWNDNFGTAIPRIIARQPPFN